MEECLVPAHRNQRFQWLGATTGMPKMRKVKLRTAEDGSGYSAVPAGGVDRGFLRARQAANQTASGRPPSITDATSTDPLPHVAETHAREDGLRSPWQNCMALG